MKFPKLTQRPAHTLLFVTEVKTFRVDTDRKGVLLGDALAIDVGCKSAAGLAKAFDKIAQAGAPLGGKVWVLFLRLTALHISVPTLQVKGVDEATLAQALQFEAEGMTGLSSMDMRIAYRFLKAEDEMSDYWLVQMEQLAWDDLIKAVKQHKCRLAGVLHPGALPMAIQDTQAAEWLRLEAWSTQLLALHRNEAHLNMLALTFDNPHWQAELEQWLQDQGAVSISESLLNNRLEMLPDLAQHFSLNETRHLTEWLSLWAQVLIKSRAAEAAVLKPQSNVNPDVVWMLSSGLSALLLCGIHAGWFMQQRVYFEAETARLSQVEKNIGELRKQIADNSEQKEKLEQKLNTIATNLDLIPDLIKTLQQRPALLLQALAIGRQQDLIIETLESQGNELVVGGIALQQQLPNQLAGFLNQHLQAMKWQVESPTKENMALFEDSPGPWSFKMKLIDIGISKVAEAAKE